MHPFGWLDDPKILRRFHGAATLGWAVMIPVSMATGLRDSVPYLVGISVWALVAGHAAAYAGARAEATNGDDVHVADLTEEQYDRLRDRILDAVTKEATMPNFNVCENCVRGDHGRCTAEDGCACLACWGNDDDDDDTQEGDE